MLQSVGIVAGLVFTTVALRREARERRAGHLVELTKLHRQLWLETGCRPELARLLRPGPELPAGPVTAAEELFVNLLIVHLSTVWELARQDKVVSQDAVKRDVRAFFALPVPRAVWERTKAVRDWDFVRFVESCLPPGGPEPAREPADAGAEAAGPQVEK